MAAPILKEEAARVAAAKSKQPHADR